MSEEFVKIETDLPDHPKVLAAGPIAGWLYIRALCWSRHYLTDGFIPDHVIEEFRLRLDRYCDGNDDQSEALASRLLEAGLFEAKPGGFLIHDYDKHQQTKQTVQERREELSRIRSQAGRKGGQASAEARRSKPNLEVRSKKLEKNPQTPLSGGSKNGPPQEPSPYAAHHGPQPERARKWIDNGLALEVPDVALRSVIADEFKITDEVLLAELVERAVEVNTRLEQRISTIRRPPEERKTL